MCVCGKASSAHFRTGAIRESKIIERNEVCGERRRNIEKRLIGDYDVNGNHRLWEEKQVRHTNGGHRLWHLGRKLEIEEIEMGRGGGLGIAGK